MRNQLASVTPRAASKGNGRENTTRSDILDSAARIIVTEGYDACTMRSISERVQIKAGSLYYHFESKDEIVVEIMNKGVTLLLEEVGNRVAALPPEAPFHLKFRAAVEAHVACKVDINTPYMQVYEHLPPVIKKESRAMRQRYAEYWHALFNEGKQSKNINPHLDLDYFIPYFLGGLNRTPEWFHREKMSIKKVSDVIVGALLSGIAIPVYS